ncbi:MAG: hypothetical protein JJT96_05800 [Opitutales bacterium]|nr:hypothetical protein [Opitutales bacterium]
MRTSSNFGRVLLGILSISFLLPALPAEEERRPVRFERPPPPPKMNEIIISTRMMLSPRVDFSGLGNVGFPQFTEFGNNLIVVDQSGTASERVLIYDDGLIRQDFSREEIIGGDAVLELVPNLDGRSANFVFQSQDQVRDDDTVSFRRFATAPIDPNAEYRASAGNVMGWEIQYRRFIDRSPRLAFAVGLGFSGFDTSVNETVEADLLVRTFFHRLSGEGGRPALPPAEFNDEGEIVRQPPYQGPRVRPDQPILVDFDPITQEPLEEVIPGGAEVSSSLEFRSSVLSLRAGPTYDLDLGRRFNLSFGAGLSASVYSSKFSVFETIRLSEGRQLDRPGARRITSDYDFLFGGYVDANASYRMNDRMRLFSGVQVHGTTSDYSATNEARRAEVSIDNQVYINAGIGIRF